MLNQKARQQYIIHEIDEVEATVFVGTRDEAAQFLGISVSGVKYGLRTGSTFNHKWKITKLEKED